MNHVGIVVQKGDEYSATIVEARRKVLRQTLGEGYAGTDNEVAVYRPKALQKHKLYAARSAEEYVGRSYGNLKLVLHVLDWALLGAYVFRRLGRIEKYPICSYLVAHACADAGIHFGVSPNAASPDDIWDWVTSQPSFELIRPLSKIQ